MTPLKLGWTMPPKPVPKCYPEAHWDNGECVLVWRGHDGLEYGDIPWPFAVAFGWAKDFRALGFYVV